MIIEIVLRKQSRERPLVGTIEVKVSEFVRDRKPAMRRVEEAMARYVKEMLP